MKKSLFTWKFDDYSLDILYSTPRAELEKEYKRLRETARKRLSRLKQAGFDNTDVYKRYYKSTLTLKQIERSNDPKKDLPHELNKVVRFLNLKTSKVSEMRKVRKKTLDTLHKTAGREFINDDNLDDFKAFMEHWRNMKLDEIYDSDKVVVLVKDALERGYTLDDIKDSFETFVKNAKELEVITIPDEVLSGKSKDYNKVSDYIRDMFENKKI